MAVTRHRAVRPHWRAMFVAVCATVCPGLPQAQAVAAPARSDATDAPRAVQAPHYGDALFTFFQQRWFASVTGLMVSQHFERMPGHEDEAELLRGALLLSYGQVEEAGRIFERLAATRPALRDRAWLYLARAHHRRGQLQEAEQALARIEAPLPGEAEDERALLLAQLLLARGAAAQAAQVLEAAARRPQASPFARYNRAVALLQAGDAAGGRAELDALGRGPAQGDEARTLRDRANLALGYAALRDDEPQAARDALQRVRLHGVSANKALLGFGWAAAALQRPSQALVPWLELAERDPGDLAVLEARLAVPYAYAELGARGQALQRYRDAVEAYDAEARALDAAVAAVRGGQALHAWIEADAEHEPGRVPQADMPALPHAAQLAPALAGHSVQEALRHHRDLRWFGRNLDTWSKSLVAFDDMLAQRRAVHAQRLPALLARAGEGAQGIAALQRQRDALVDTVSAAERDADGTALADTAELALRERLERLRSAQPALANEVDGGGLGERVRRLAGALTWRLAQAHPQRLWAAKKELAAIDAELAQAQASQLALERAQREQPARFEQLAGRLDSLAARVARLEPQVAALAREQRTALQDELVAALDGARQQLAQYGAQARFALAQLQDQPVPTSAETAPEPSATNLTHRMEARRATAP